MQNSHKIYEDLFALLSAGLLVALGLTLFSAHSILAGGTAGIAVIAANTTPLSFGALFFLVNLPFYYLGWKQLGKRFTFNTFVSVSVVSVAVEHVDKVLTIDNVHPLFSAIAGGMLIGMGLLIMFRHKSSLGGIGILAVFLQERFGIKAGSVQMMVDTTIMAISGLIFGLEVMLYAILSAVVLNVVLLINHKPGRYQALGPATTAKEEAQEQAAISKSIESDIDDAAHGKAC